MNAFRRTGGLNDTRRLGCVSGSVSSLHWHRCRCVCVWMKSIRSTVRRQIDLPVTWSLPQNIVLLRPLAICALSYSLNCFLAGVRAQFWPLLLAHCLTATGRLWVFINGSACVMLAHLKPWWMSPGSIRKNINAWHLHRVCNKTDERLVCKSLAVELSVLWKGHKLCNLCFVLTLCVASHTFLCIIFYLYLIVHMHVWSYTLKE